MVKLQQQKLKRAPLTKTFLNHVGPKVFPLLVFDDFIVSVIRAQEPGQQPFNVIIIINIISIISIMLCKKMHNYNSYYIKSI